MRAKNNSKIYTAAIISTFFLGMISFGIVIKKDYNNINTDNGFQQPSHYNLFR